MRPRDIGGVLEDSGMVEVVSCLTKDGQPIANDIRKGVWVAIEADSEYMKNCFEEYSVTTDDTGRYMAAHKKWHMIGLELAISVASIALRGEPTGYARVLMPMWSLLPNRICALAQFWTGKAGQPFMAVCVRHIQA